MNLHDLRLRSSALFFRSRVEEEMEDELGFHVEMQTRKNLEQGMSAREAALQARIQFGGRDVARESCRDERRIQVVENLFKDVRYALRGLRRAPAFALAVIGTIALGLGWNTAVFTIFNAYVLRPLAVSNPNALYELSWNERNGRGHSFGWSEFLDLEAQQRSFSQMAAYSLARTRLEGRFAQVTMVSGGYFEMLGVPAFMGRTLVAGDSGSAVLVLSYSAWRNRFAADPLIIGRKLSLRGVPFEVVGVMPESFSGLDTRFRFDLWTPIVPSSLTGPNEISVAARLNSHVTMQQAQSELAVLIPRVAPLASAVQRASVFVYLRPLATSVRPSALIAAILLIAIPFAMVFLSACANVANMMLARALSRQREIGIRLSLGAGRSRLIQQLLVESLMLALPAALLGFVMARGMIVLGEGALFATIPANFLEYIRIAPLAPDVRVFGFVLAAAVASALLFGLAPAMQATRVNLVQAAHGQFNGSMQPSRLRNVLVTAQVTVSALFLIMCGVFIRGANAVQHLDTGMRTRDVMEIEVQERSRTAALRKLSTAPGIGTLAAAAHPPLDSHLPTALAVRAGGGESLRLPYTYVSPGYFPVFDMPVLRGRNFTAEEARAQAAVAVLSESAAHRLFPGRDAIGEPLRVSPDAGPPIQAQVVGIARDTAIYLDDADQGRTCLYFPSGLDSPGAVLLARVPDSPEAANRRIRALLEDGDPGAVERIDPMQAFVDVRDYPFRALYWISAAVGAIALLFTLSGIYGVVSHAVAQRTKEIGIRMALGASIRAVTRLVVGQCVRLAGWGIAIGAVLALAASKILSTQVFIRPFDGWAYAGAILLVMLACVAAAVFPARRVARVDPLATLRHD